MEPDDTPRVVIQNYDGKYAIETVTNSAELDLTIGPRYMQNEIRCNSANYLGVNTSGVMGKWKPAKRTKKFDWNVNVFRIISVLGINDGTGLVTKLHHGASIQTYHVSGKFGKATETNFKDSILTVRAAYHHVFPGKLTSLIASMQASHQRQMFEMSGVDIQSQNAYELACKGPIRPMNRENPMIYGIQCIEFKRPEFTLEIHAMNASEQYLCNIIAEIGLQMRSVAHCIKLRCTRYGFFTFEDSLVRGKWRPQNMLENMLLCRKIITENKSMLTDKVSTPVGHANEIE